MQSSPPRPCPSNRPHSFLRRAGRGSLRRVRAFAMSVRLKFLRGTPFDILGQSEERRIERQLIANDETLLDELLASLAPNHALAVKLARIPERFAASATSRRRAASPPAPGSSSSPPFRTPPAPHAIAAE